MVTDFKKLQYKRKRIRLIKKLAGMLIFLTLAVVLYTTKDKWFHSLEGIGSKYDTTISGITGQGFPLKISGGIHYQSAFLDSSLALLGDTTLRLYGADGSVLATRQHAYSNAIMKSSGKRLLIYDLGGNTLRLESKRKTVFEKTLEDKIIFAEISEDGYVAAVTTSDRYICVLTVYDPSGKNIYSRGSIDRIISVCFTDGSKGCYAASVYASSGEMYSRIDRYEFSQNAENLSTVPLDTFCVSAYNNNDALFVLGDTLCGFYDAQCKLINSEPFDAKLTAYAFGKSGCAVFLSNADTRRGTLILWSDPQGKPVTLHIDSDCADISVYGDYIYLLGGYNISVYDFEGALKGYKELDDSYDEIVPADYGIIVRGYDSVDLVDMLID